jgi:apolipoprotein N-acyltransferase
MAKTRKIDLACVLLGGIFMGLSVAPIGVWLLAWIALIPLWVAIYRCRTDPLPLVSSTRFQLPCARNPIAFSAYLALAWGIGYNGIALSWIAGIHPLTWMGVPWLNSLGIAAFCWVFVTLWATALTIAWAMSMAWVCRQLENPPAKPFKGLTAWSPLVRPLVRVLLGTALWCGLDTLWTHSILWWPSISYTQSPANLAILQLGKLSGHHAIVAAIVAVNGLLAEAWISRSSRRQGLGYLSSAIVLGLGLHLFGFSLYQYPIADRSEMALKVGIIQGNISNRIKVYEEGVRKAIAGYTSGYEALVEMGVQAVLTPETAIPLFWPSDRLDRAIQTYDIAAPLYQAILDRKIPIWVGTFGKAGRSYTNSLLAVDGTGKTLARYDKVKLVPLGEYIPLASILGRFVDRLSPLEANMIPGASNQVFETPFGRAIVAICYESAFGYRFQQQAARGGESILSVANNDHYAPSMPPQHHALDVMRAIETDRWAVRATNTGYSAIVDPHGNTRWRSQLGTYEIHADTIYRRQSQTPYVRWGDWLTPILLGFAFFLILPFLV